jgi:protein-disulfide isomerase
MRRFFGIAACLAAIAFAAPMLATPGRAEMDAATKDEIGQIVHDYILAHPEILQEAAKALQEKQDQEAAETQKKTIAENADAIFHGKSDAVLGNPKGAITLVEFFDYNCPYCKHAVSDMTALIAANPDLRVVLKEFPILSDGSVEAARVAVAVNEMAPDKYLKFHQELFSRPGQASSEKALGVATDLGLDKKAITKIANAQDVTDDLQAVHQLALDLGISGTPSYVIGAEVVPGALGVDGLQAKVNAVRQCGATIC